MATNEPKAGELKVEHHGEGRGPSATGNQLRSITLDQGGKQVTFRDNLVSHSGGKVFHETIIVETIKPGEATTAERLTIRDGKIEELNGAQAGKLTDKQRAHAAVLQSEAHKALKITEVAPVETQRAVADKAAPAIGKASDSIVSRR